MTASTESCAKVEELAELRAKSRSQGEILRSVQSTLEEISKLLERIATQGVRIDGIDKTLMRHDSQFENLFSRVRDLELLPGKKAGKIYFALVGGLVGIASGAVSGIVVFIVTKG